MGTDEAINKTQYLPLTCTKEHQIYIVRFEQLGRYGFGCGLCHTLGVSLTHGQQMLEIVSKNARPDVGPDLRAELLLGTGAKGFHVQCGRGHYLMGVRFPSLEAFGFGCIHCKSYSLQFAEMGEVLEIRTVRKLAKSDPLYRPVTEDPTFSRIIH